MEVNFGNCEKCNQDRKKKCPFLHYPKGGESAPWRVKIVHGLTTLKAIYGGTIIGSVIDAIAIYRFATTEEWHKDPTIQFWGYVFIALLTGFIFSVIFVSMLIGHYKSQRWLLSDIMHRISHELRDMNATVNKIKDYECTKELNHIQCGYTLLMLYGNRIADYIEQYFSLLTKGVLPYFDRQDLRCVIRLTAAYRKDCTERSATPEYEKKYYTVGRSKAYNLSAKKVSKPFSAEYGVFGILAFKKHQGVLMCNDLEAARMMGYWSDPVDTVKNIRPIQSIMVVPINGYIDGAIRNIGTITVDTYRKGEVFQRPHIDIFRAIADQLGAVFPSVIRNLFSCQPLNSALPEYIDTEPNILEHCTATCSAKSVDDQST